MYETNATVIGTVVTDPVKRDLLNGDQVVTFRMASNSRRFDNTTGQWVDNGTLFLTVVCWRRLVDGVDRSLHRGDPVIAHGQLRTHDYRTRDGAERRDVELRASAIGPDLSRCTAQVFRRSEQRADSAPDGAMRNTCAGSNAANHARVGEGPGDSAATVSSTSTRGAEPEPVDA
ncbi:single-stranded DNA-binding protein [Nocardia sp. NPDC052566]|uniref:single-stranded DNA-binding protein n=1 Tax=Nocardia sp. NPDC052566 TaxID=3364330 RepID=UPI0037CB8DEC